MYRLHVKEVAEKQSWTMSGLSRASDISFKTVKRLFREPTADVNISTLVALAKVLQVSLDALVEIQEDE